MTSEFNDIIDNRLKFKKKRKGGKQSHYQGQHCGKTETVGFRKNEFLVVHLHIYIYRLTTAICLCTNNSPLSFDKVNE